MKSKMIELPEEIIQDIVAEEMEWLYNTMCSELSKYRDKDHGFISIFSTDPEEDKRMIRKMKKAAKMILDYYGGNDE